MVINFHDPPTLEPLCHEYHEDINLGFIGAEEHSKMQNIHQHLSNFTASELAAQGKLQPGLRAPVELPERAASSKAYVFQKPHFQAKKNYSNGETSP